MFAVQSEGTTEEPTIIMSDDDEDEEISFSSAFKIPTGLKVLTTDNFTCLMCQLGDRRREWQKNRIKPLHFVPFSYVWRSVYDIQQFHC